MTPREAGAAGADRPAEPPAGPPGEAAEALAPEVDLLPGLDVASFSRALGGLVGGLQRNPQRALPVVARWAGDFAAAAATTGARLVLGPRAVLTPLAREKARALGVVVEKERR
jgi:hypothetical protein